MNTRAIKEIVRRYNLAISPRRMGQNFLVDPRMLARIAATVEATAGDIVLEIGAGLGALTGELLQSGATVYAVERDARFVRVLTDRFREAANLQMVRSDILRLDLGSYAMGEPKRILVAGNIPFSMTSPILEFLLHQRRWVRRVVLTVQKEVALRIIAEPGTKEYASITLLTQIAFRPKIAFTIPPNAFYPQPKVTSAVMCLEPLSEPVVPPEEEEGVLRLVRMLFTHRRKTLLNALSFSGKAEDRSILRGALEKAGLDPIRRPDTLGFGELLKLRRALPAR